MGDDNIHGQSITMSDFVGQSPSQLLSDNHQYLCPWTITKAKVHGQSPKMKSMDIHKG